MRHFYEGLEYQGELECAHLGELSKHRLWARRNVSGSESRGTKREVDSKALRDSMIKVTQQ